MTEHALYARVVDGIVAEVRELDADQVEFLTGLLPGAIVPCGEEVEQGDTHDGETFSRRDTTPSLDVLKDRARRAVDERRDATLRAGYLADFGEPIGVRRLDLRGNSDESFWMRHQSRVSDILEYKIDEPTLPVIDADNAIFESPVATLSETVSALFAWREAWQMAARRLKNRINAATSAAELDAIDLDSGWPE